MLQGPGGGASWGDCGQLELNGRERQPQRRSPARDVPWTGPCLSQRRSPAGARRLR